MQWFVVYTKPKSEIKVASMLKEIGVEAYCPVYKSVRQWSDRKKKVSVPLFRSYVFVFLESKSRDIVFNVPGVVRYLYWLGKPALVREEEIVAIKQFLSKTENLSTGDKEYSFGTKITIDKGPFKGTEGKFLYKQRNQLVLEVPSLGSYVKVFIHQSQVN